MTPQDDIEIELVQFGERWRNEPSIAKSVRVRIDTIRRPLVVRRGLIQWFGDLTMKQRITYASATVALLVFLAAVFATSSSPTMLAQVTRNIGQATSYSVRMTIESVGDELPSAGKHSMSKTVYWRSPGSYRFETTMEEGRITEIIHRDKPGIRIDESSKSYSIRAARQGRQSSMITLEKLGQYRGSSQKVLERKTIDGKVCEGFELGIRDIDPDASDGTVAIWVEPEAKLPVLVEMRLSEPIPMVMRLDHFKWNVDLPATLFDVSPPEGYANKTRPPTDVIQQVADITAALKLYAELSGGHYPKVKMLYGDVTRDEMRKMAGFKGAFQVEWLQDEQFQKITAATTGLARINVILRDNPDAAFRGTVVGPQDADKALLHWKLPDGQFQVIYGDLKSKTVSADTRRGLE